MKATDIATRAGELVGGDRKDAYGDAEEGLARVAAIWNGIMTAAGKAPARPLDPFDVAQLMAGLKMARGYTGPYRPDNAVDQAGWSAIAGEVAAKFRENVSRSTNEAFSGDSDDEGRFELGCS